MVTSVPVAAMSDNIAKLIQDIDKLDGHRRNMMEELNVLRDITLFYQEQHPELRGTSHSSVTRRTTSRGQHDTPEAPDKPRQTEGDTAGGSDTDNGETKEHT